MDKVVDKVEIPDGWVPPVSVTVRARGILNLTGGAHPSVSLSLSSI